jgi:membrane fusion protein
MSLETSNSSLPLFRPETLSARDKHALGALRLAQPLSAWLISASALAIAAALIAFVTFGAVTRKSHVAGITVPHAGSISIAAPNAGVLIRTHIKEGQVVTVGQTLFEVSTARQAENGELTALIGQQLATRQTTLASEQHLRTTQYRDKKQATYERLQNLAMEAEQLTQEIALAQRRHELALQSLGKFEMLQQNGYVSAAQTQQKQEEAIDLAAKLGSLKRNTVQLQATRLALQADLAALETGLATDLAQLERAQASLQQEMAENQSRKSAFVTAPNNGTVTAIAYEPGQTVAAGQMLATLIPSDAGGKNQGGSPTLEAHLYAPSRAAGFVVAGQRVLIRYQAYPYQKFGLQAGTVIDVGRTPFAPGELPQHLASTILSNAQQSILGANSNEALYRIKVRPDHQTIDAYGQAQALKPGMTLEADVMQDKRRIWEWVVEPLLAVTQR